MGFKTIRTTFSTSNRRLMDEASPLDKDRGKTYGEFWKYRVGDIRIIARIEDAELLILVVGVGHRKNIYK